MKPLMSDAEIKRRKKLQGNLSMVGGTLGLGALAARGGATVMAGKRVGKLVRVAPHPAREQKLKDISTGLTTVGAGLGGAGAYNFAAYTKAESRKRSQFQKNYGGTMDFGLDGVRQGRRVVEEDEVSKAIRLNSKDRQDINSAGNTGAVIGAAGGAVAAQTARAGKAAGAGYSLSRGVLHSAPAEAIGAAGRAARVGIRTPSRALFTTTAAGSIGASIAAATRKKKKIIAAKEADVSKADWMNITEHQRRARDSRRTQRRGNTVAALGYSAAGTSAGLSMARGKNAVRQARNVAVSTKRVGQAEWKMRGVKGPLRAKARSRNLTALKGVARRNGYGVGLLAGGAAVAGGLATSAGAHANEKRHDRAIASQRKQRALTSVGKAYDPERNRQRRLDHASTASAGLAGATGAAAVVTAKGALGKPSRPTWKMNAKKATSTKVMSKPTGVFAASGKEVRAAGKGLGKAGALGLTAVGLGVGADRIRSYKQGRGGRYTPLH